jgi:hypothetical protein
MMPNPPLRGLLRQSVKTLKTLRNLSKKRRFRRVLKTFQEIPSFFKRERILEKAAKIGHFALKKWQKLAVLL